jgi:Zn-dependent peptidase ImmA (M78 family)/predicted secreted protein
MFQPLDHLFGFYSKDADVAVIVVNASHPASLQRYTAAHEYGHHVLGHGFSLDEVRNIDGARGVDEAQDFEQVLAARSTAEIGDPLEEAAAQAFAGTFLMPIQVVNRALIDRGFDRDHPQLGPADIYELSLEFGTSYEATVTHLASLEKITWPEARQLRIPPIQIKTTLAGGSRPLDARADVWLVQDTDPERELPLRIGDEIVLRLPEIPSSGYAWTLQANEFEALELIEETASAVEDEEDVYGGHAVRRVHLRAIRPGNEDIAVALSRPWEQEDLQRIVVHVDVATDPTGDAPTGLIRGQQLQRVLVA